MGVQVFTDLLIWQRARKWSKAIFRHALTDTFARDRRLVEQINDSSESVMSNIAEGSAVAPRANSSNSSATLWGA